MGENCYIVKSISNNGQSNKRFDPYLKTNEITIKEQQSAPFLSKWMNSFIHRSIYETEYRSPELMAQYCYSGTTETVYRLL